MDKYLRQKSDRQSKRHSQSQPTRQSKRLSQYQDVGNDEPPLKSESIYDNSRIKTRNTGKRGGSVFDSTNSYSYKYWDRRRREKQQQQQKDAAAALRRSGQFFEGITSRPNRSSPPPLLQLPNVTGLSCFFSSALLLLQDHRITSKIISRANAFHLHQRDYIFDKRNNFSPDQKILDMVPHFLAVVAAIHLNIDDKEHLWSLLVALFDASKFPRQIGDPVEFLEKCICPLLRGFKLGHLFEVPQIVECTGRNDNGAFHRRRSDSVNSGYIPIHSLKDNMQLSMEAVLCSTFDESYQFNEYFDNLDMVPNNPNATEDERETYMKLNKPSALNALQQRYKCSDVEQTNLLDESVRTAEYLAFQLVRICTLDDESAGTKANTDIMDVNEVRDIKHHFL